MTYFGKFIMYSEPTQKL